MSNYRSLSHTKWDCKYHVVFIPKYRRKAIFGQIRKYLGEVLRKLAEQLRIPLILNARSGEVERAFRRC